MRLTAVLTSFNRRELTLQCLAKLAQAAQLAEVEIDAVLVDDGCTDGTAAAVRKAFDWVRVLQGDGSLFWNRGMHMAMGAAMADATGDAILWLNDDTLLMPDALQRLLAAQAQLQVRHGRPGIVVGATADDGGRLSYSGCVANGRWRVFSFRKVFSETEALPCDTMNGNVVLIPMAVARVVGNLDPVFEHSMGDLDYGLRARRAGVPLVVAAGHAGRCRNNPVAGGFMDPALPLRKRWRLFVNRKVLPPRSWRHMTRKHGGILWPVYFAWPYVSFFARALLGTRRPAA